ncbi:hypothetical protein HFO49_09365 [Rhizobium leguminosarum]|uniref:glycine betaine ABC transporter substrate-binding protein n=1 Tax=Rhizobium leguminosarum TaxID=384 RepID=UPI001C94CB55|nr:hypothetical protein [Rhizobium leguminosarum]
MAPDQSCERLFWQAKSICNRRIPATRPTSSIRPATHCGQTLTELFDEAKALDYKANKIVWLDRAPANNIRGIGLRADVAEKNGVKTMSDFGRFIAAGVLPRSGTVAFSDGPSCSRFVSGAPGNQA